jgi:acyl-CoA thioester hydrolase
MSSLPTVEQIMQLGTARELEVGPEHLDVNEHMNVFHYFDIGATAMGDTFAQFGLSGDLIASRGQSIFTVEHHLRYYSEMRLGTPLSVHVRLLGRSKQAMHAMSFLIDQEKKVLSFTLELSAVNVDFTSRRSAEFGDDTTAGMDALVARQDALGWDAPVCGAMQLRNPVIGV